VFRATSKTCQGFVTVTRRYGLLLTPSAKRQCSNRPPGTFSFQNDWCVIMAVIMDAFRRSSAFFDLSTTSAAGSLRHAGDVMVPS
jgi:hypothetical protein